MEFERTALEGEIRGMIPLEKQEQKTVREQISVVDKALRFLQMVDEGIEKRKKAERRAKEGLQKGIVQMKLQCTVLETALAASVGEREQLQAQLELQKQRAAALQEEEVLKAQILSEQMAYLALQQEHQRLIEHLQEEEVLNTKRLCQIELEK